MSLSHPPIFNMRPQFLLWYEDLAKEGLMRQERYRKFFQEVIPESEWKLIRERVNRGGITGGEKFREEVEKVLGRRVSYNKTRRKTWGDQKIITSPFSDKNLPLTRNDHSYIKFKS